jgi:hypothetical protein
MNISQGKKSRRRKRGASGGGKNIDQSGIMNTDQLLESIDPVSQQINDTNPNIAKRRGANLILDLTKAQNYGFDNDQKNTSLVVDSSILPVKSLSDLPTISNMTNMTNMTDLSKHSNLSNNQILGEFSLNDSDCGITVFRKHVTVAQYTNTIGGNKIVMVGKCITLSINQLHQLISLTAHIAADIDHVFRNVTPLSVDNDSSNAELDIQYSLGNQLYLIIKPNACNAHLRLTFQRNNGELGYSKRGIVLGIDPLQQFLSSLDMYLKLMHMKIESPSPTVHSYNIEKSTGVNYNPVPVISPMIASASTSDKTKVLISPIRAPSPITAPSSGLDSGYESKTESEILNKDIQMRLSGKKGSLKVQNILDNVDKFLAPSSMNSIVKKLGIKKGIKQIQKVVQLVQKEQKKSLESDDIEKLILKSDMMDPIYGKKRRKNKSKLIQNTGNDSHIQSQNTGEELPCYNYAAENMSGVNINPIYPAVYESHGCNAPVAIISNSDMSTPSGLSSYKVEPLPYYHQKPLIIPDCSSKPTPNYEFQYNIHNQSEIPFRSEYYDQTE